jgi:DNA-binding XRE family transcriptional regulator
MTNHEKFKSLLNRAGISRHDLAEHLGLTYGSVQNQLAPSKNLPRWAKSIMLYQERREKIKEKESEENL